MSEERKGLNLALDQVKEFHEVFNHPVGKSVCSIGSQRKITRATWMREEIDEYLDADGNIAKETDAILDLIYFALGCLVEAKIENPQKIFDMIQHANMSKIWPDGLPHFREDGKVIKPVGWKAPDDEIEEYIQKIK